MHICNTYNISNSQLSASIPNPVRSSSTASQNCSAKPMPTVPHGMARQSRDMATLDSTMSSAPNTATHASPAEPESTPTTSRCSPTSAAPAAGTAAQCSLAA